MRGASFHTELAQLCHPAVTMASPRSATFATNLPEFRQLFPPLRVASAPRLHSILFASTRLKLSVLPFCQRRDQAHCKQTRNAELGEFLGHVVARKEIIVPSGFEGSECLPRRRIAFQPYTSIFLSFARVVLFEERKGLLQNKGSFDWILRIFTIFANDNFLAVVLLLKVFILCRRTQNDVNLIIILIEHRAAVQLL